MMTHGLLWSSAFIALALLGPASSSVGQQLTEYPLDPLSAPTQITAGPDGRIWYSDPRGSNIGALSATQPAQVFQVSLPGPMDSPLAFPSPFGICSGPDGNIWFTASKQFGLFPKVGRMKVDGTYSLFDFPENLFAPGRIISGPDGNLWFSASASKVVRFSPDGTSKAFSIPTFRASAGSLVVGADGAIWFTELNAAKIGRITMTGAITEFELPAGHAYALAAGPDGAIWFTLTNEKRIGRLTMSGMFSSFPLPSDSAKQIVAGPDGNLWFGEQNGRIGRITVEGQVTEFATSTADPGIEGITVGSDGAIWFAESNVSKIGRITTGGCAISATSLCLNNQRFEATVDWSVGIGNEGKGKAVAITADTGYFWFFSPNNIELAVKVVDGRAVNSHFWVFAGALSDVAYSITLRDTLTGTAKTYTNAAGALASFADTEAF
ncbi:MAG: hypothetical protein ABI682_09870 [Acidobacteriota bacterium]